MSAKAFYLRILLLFALASLIGMIVFFGFGRQAYRLYAWPVALLGILPFLSSAMKTRMMEMGIRPRRRYWLLVPLFLIAILRIGYWSLFFASQELATLMHVILAQVSYLAGPFLKLPYLLILALALWFLVRLGRNGRGVPAF